MIMLEPHNKIYSELYMPKDGMQKAIIQNIIGNQFKRAEEFSEQFVQWIVDKWPNYVPADVSFHEIRTGKTRLPYSYKQLVDMFSVKEALKVELQGVESDEDIVKTYEKENKKNVARVNQTGDVTLKAIGNELNGITAAAVKLLGDAAQEKFRSFAMLTKKDRRGKQKVYQFDMEDEEWYEKAEEAAEIFVNLAKKGLEATKGEPLYAPLPNGKWELVEDGEYSVEEFLEDMLQEGYLTPNEASLVKEPEWVALHLLLSLIAEGKEEKAKDYLVTDLALLDNIVKVFQNINAKLWFPAGKRGRPPKNST